MQPDLVAAYRVHLREMTTARQAAEARHRRLPRGCDKEDRRAAELALREELAGTAAEHAAWLRDHGVGGRA